MKQKVMSAVFGVLVFLCGYSAAAQETNQYRFVGYQIGFDGGDPLGFGNQKILLADMGDIAVASNLLSGVITGREIIRRIDNAETNSAGEKLYFSSFEVTAGDNVEPIEGTTVLEGQLVLRILTEDGGFPFYFNTTTNVALAFPGVDAEQGSGDLGLGLLIRKGSGLAVSDVQGSYAGCFYGHQFDSQGLSSGDGNVDQLKLSRVTMAFDGAGAFTGAANEWAMSRTLSDQEITEGDDRYIDTVAAYGSVDNSLPLAGSYSLSGDGVMLIADGEDAMPLQLSADANLAASAFGGDREAACLLFLKQPTDMPSATSNIFTFIELSDSGGQWGSDECVDELESSRNYIFLMPDHTFSMRSDFWTVRNRLTNLRETIEPPSLKISRNAFSTEIPEKRVEFESGTYNIAPDGAVMLNFENGNIGMGQISANGEYLLAAYASAEGPAEYSHGLIVGIRRIPPASPQPSTLAIDSTPTGAVIEVTSAPETPFEALYSGDLLEGEWASAGFYTNTAGTLMIPDPSSTNAVRRYYTGSFVPW